MSTAEWTLEVALDAAVDCIERHLPGYLAARLAEDALRARPLLNGHLPMPKVVTTGMIDDLAADWVTPAIFLNANSTSYQNYNASSLLDSQPRITATVLLAEGDVNTSEQRIYSNALSMYSDGVRFILSTIFPQDGGCEVGVNAATPDSVQYSPVVRPDGYSVWLRWSEVSVVWTQRVNNYWQTGPPTPPPFDPLSLDPLAWWDAADASTLFVDAAGTVPAVVGDPIGRILDKSGKGRHAMQTVSANRPLYDQVGSLLSEANAQVLQVVANVGYPRTIFAWTGRMGGNVGWVATAAQFTVSPDTTSDSSRAAIRSTGVGTFGTGSIAWGASKHIIATDDGSELWAYSDVDSASVLLPAGASVLPENNNPFVLFRSTRFKRVMIFDRVLTADERAQLFAWAVEQG